MGWWKGTSYSVFDYGKDDIDCYEDIGILGVIGCIHIAIDRLWPVVNVIVGCDERCLVQSWPKCVVECLAKDRLA